MVLVWIFWEMSSAPVFVDIITSYPYVAAPLSSLWCGKSNNQPSCSYDRRISNSINFNTSTFKTLQLLVNTQGSAQQVQT